MSLWIAALLIPALGAVWGLRRLRRKWVHDELEEIEIRALRGRSELERQVTTYRVERAELETVLNAISEAVLAVDAEGNPRYFNAQFLRDFGGKDFAARKPRLAGLFRSPEILELFARVGATREPEHLSLPLNTLERGMRDFRISATSLSASAAGGGAVGVFHDVTEIRRAEKVRIDFVANVSHELRTPMTSIKGYAETLQSELPPSEDSISRKCADVIARNTDRLMELVDDLMDLSAIESNREDSAFSRARVDVAELTERVLQQVEPLRKEKNHVIEVTAEAPTLRGDARRVEQVLRNLIENSIRYVPDGGRIAIHWVPIPAPGAPGTRLRVIDNGPGIPAEHQPRVFERFYRVDPGRSRQMGGTGLGLAIVKHIMLRHGGSVNILSAAGQGTEFFCDFPQ